MKYGLGIWDPGIEIRDLKKNLSWFGYRGQKRNRILICNMGYV
jgi:hypothetical protein